MNQTNRESNTFTQFKHLADELRQKVDEFQSIPPGARKKLLEGSGEVSNVQVLLSELVSCQSRCIQVGAEAEEEFQTEQEVSDVLHDRSQESELHLQILKDEVNDLKRFRELGEGVSDPNEVIRGELQERGRLTRQMEQLKLEEMNAAHSLLGRKAEYDKLNSKFLHLQEFFSLFSPSQTIYSDTASDMEMMPRDIYELPLPLFMIYMRLSVYVINKKDPNLECVAEEIQDLPENSHPATLPYSFSIVLSYKRKYLKFYFHPDIQVVSVRHNIATQDGILLKIYQNDDGATSPNPSTFYLLKAASSSLSMDALVSEGHTGRMYRWSQVLGGLSFYPEKQDELEIQVTSFDVIRELDSILSSDTKSQ